MSLDVTIGIKPISIAENILGKSSFIKLIFHLEGYLLNKPHAPLTLYRLRKKSIPASRYPFIISSSNLSRILLSAGLHIFAKSSSLFIPSSPHIFFELKIENIKLHLSIYFLILLIIQNLKIFITNISYRETLIGTPKVIN